MTFNNQSASMQSTSFILYRTTGFLCSNKPTVKRVNETVCLHAVKIMHIYFYLFAVPPVGSCRLGVGVPQTHAWLGDALVHECKAIHAGKIIRTVHQYALTHACTLAHPMLHGITRFLFSIVTFVTHFFISYKTMLCSGQGALYDYFIWLSCGTILRRIIGDEAAYVAASGGLYIFCVAPNGLWPDCAMI